MTCFMCKSSVLDGFSTFTTDMGGCVVIIKNVPSNICNQCGETTYNEPPRGKPRGIFKRCLIWWEVRSARKFIKTSCLIPNTPCVASSDLGKPRGIKPDFANNSELWFNLPCVFRIDGALDSDIKSKIWKWSILRNQPSGTPLFPP